MEGCFRNFVRRVSPKKWATKSTESVKRAQKKCVTLRRVLATNTDEFCKNTTLHGLKYVNNQSLHPAERFVQDYNILTLIPLSIPFSFHIFSRVVHSSLYRL